MSSSAKTSVYFDSMNRTLMIGLILLGVCNMKKLFRFITRSYEPKPNDFLVLSWFFLFCGLIGLVLYILGELHSVGDFGFFGFFFILALYSRRCRSRKRSDGQE